LTHWVRKIVTHTAIDFVRSKQSAALKARYDPEMTDFEVAPSVLSKLTAADVHQFIQTLPKATAMVFNMFIYEEFQHKEIAEILNISEGTSKWHMNEARRLLKKRIDSLKSITNNESIR
jgi:RNA polymerase sigma-70 factor (ECF subfamily)